jgi:hypothetical protein
LGERRAVERRCEEDRSEGLQPLLSPRSQTLRSWAPRALMPVHGR